MKDQIIIIHWDYTNGDEKSYMEVKESNDKIVHTHCLNFFSFDTEVTDVIVMKKNGSFISRNDLLIPSKNIWCCKEIRRGHNICKLLIANTFEF